MLYYFEETEVFDFFAEKVKIYKTRCQKERRSKALA